MSALGPLGPQLPSQPPPRSTPPPSSSTGGPTTNLQPPKPSSRSSTPTLSTPGPGPSNTPPRPNLTQTQPPQPQPHTPLQPQTQSQPQPELPTVQPPTTPVRALRLHGMPFHLELLPTRHPFLTSHLQPFLVDLLTSIDHAILCSSCMTTMECLICQPNSLFSQIVKNLLSTKCSFDPLFIIPPFSFFFLLLTLLFSLSRSSSHSGALSFSFQLSQTGASLDNRVPTPASAASGDLHSHSQHALPDLPAQETKAELRLRDQRDFESASGKTEPKMEVCFCLFIHSGLVKLSSRSHVESIHVIRQC